MNSFSQHRQLGLTIWIDRGAVISSNITTADWWPIITIIPNEIKGGVWSRFGERTIRKLLLLISENGC